MCSINFPFSIVGPGCPVCGTELRKDLNLEHHEDWRDQMEARKAEQIESERERAAFLQVKAKIRETAKGHFTLDSRDVVRAGINHRLPVDTIILVQDPDTLEWSWWEVGSYVYSKRYYWVEPFSTSALDTFPVEWVDGD